MWTKEEIIKISKLWEHSRTEDIAEELGVLPQQVSYMVYTMRKAGYPMAKKHVKGRLSSLIQEVAAEQGIRLRK